MKLWFSHLVHYFSALVKLWFTWAFIAVDLVGYFLINLPYILPDIKLPPLSRELFYGLNVLGFIIVNTHLFSRWESEKESLLKRVYELESKMIRENSVVVSLHPRPNREGAELSYVIGDEPIDTQVWLLYEDKNGDTVEQQVKERFSQDDHLLGGNHVYRTILEPGGGYRFWLPQRDEVKSGKVIIKVCFTGLRSNKTFISQKPIELKTIIDSSPLFF